VPWDPEVCNYEGNWGTRTAFRELGLDLRPKAKGGDIVCYESTHGDVFEQHPHTVDERAYMVCFDMQGRSVAER
jgi:hypothetical protein